MKLKENLVETTSRWRRMTVDEIEKIRQLNQRYNRFGYFVSGILSNDVVIVSFFDEGCEYHTETATIAQLDVFFTGLEKAFNENCAVLELEPSAITISAAEEKLLDAGNDALFKLMDCADENSNEADAAKSKFVRMMKASHEVFPREIAEDLDTEVRCRLRLKHGSIAYGWLTC